MKKIFWTSIVWIVIFGLFVLYMKFFNQPLAKWFANFVVNVEKRVPEIEEIIDEDNILDNENIDLKEKMDIDEEYMSSNQDDENWDKLFNQLDRIELFIGKNETISQEENEEEMFDQFKLWYEESKK